MQPVRWVPSSGCVREKQRSDCAFAVPMMLLWASNCVLAAVLFQGRRAAAPDSRPSFLSTGPVIWASRNYGLAGGGIQSGLTSPHPKYLHDRGLGGSPGLRTDRPSSPVETGTREE